MMMKMLTFNTKYWKYKSLGIREDGDLNDCSPEDSFVMGNHEYSKDTFHNSAHFSNCSIKQFHEIAKKFIL